MGVVSLNKDNRKQDPEPTTWVCTSSSRQANTKEAAEEAFQKLHLELPPKLLIAFAAPHYDLNELSMSLSERLTGCPLVGCTTAGEISAGKALTNSLVLWALGGEGVRVSTGMGKASEGGLRRAALEAARCLDDLERRTHTVMLLLTDGLAGNQMEVVRGAYDTANIDVPLVGGCAGDYLAMQETKQIFGAEVFSDVVVAAAISSDNPLGIGVSHGWSPASGPMLVTESNDTMILSLDDKPALDVYLDFFSPPQSVRENPNTFADFAAIHPIGIRRKDRIEMRHISGFDPEKRALITIAEVPQGALAFLTEGDYSTVMDAAVTSVQTAIEALGTQSPAGLLLFDCVSRRAIFGDNHLQEETKKISDCCNQAPMAGFYTYGEIARTRGSGGFHNQTLVTLAIG